MLDTNFYSLRIKEIKKQTLNSVCISFDVPKNLKETFKFNPGQFLTLKTTINQHAVRRSYSICSGINESSLKVGIKKIENGVFSSYANEHFKVGDVVNVMPPQGSFSPTLNKNNAKHYMCIAAGSGITPILSIIQSVLSQEPASKVTLIYGNKSTQTIMFKEELSFLKNRYLSRLQWINIMSQEDQGSDVLKGKINNAKGAMLQSSNLIDISTIHEAYICGPESMISEVSRGFRKQGLKESQINYELFANSSSDTKKIIQKSKQRIKKYGEQKESRITILADGRSLDFKLATVGENILDAGINHGMELPYSCKAGVCSTCKAKVLKGKVDMDIDHGLESHEKAAGLILTCQAHPISDEVTISFDDR
jgi:ring-1,2-phenylacetyl-CoA epoxidase subunit PaaE